MRAMVLKMLLLIVVLYAGACYYLYSTQEKKVFNRKYVEHIEPKIAKKIEFKTSDGKILDGAFTENGKNLPLVLYFGGNASNVITFLDDIATKIKDFNFIGFNYPGYGKSEGNPTQKNVLKYADEIYKKYQPDIVAGRSLGTTVAVYVASKNKAKKLLLITPIDSILNVAKAKYPYLPISMLLKEKFQADVWAKDLEAKVAIILVENENIVPKESVDNILKSIKNIVYKSTIKDVNHINLYSSKETIGKIKRALEKLQ
jgi:alpha/beta superfamily hydrolase